MAWLKQVDLSTARSTRTELSPTSEAVLERRRRTPNPLSLRQLKGTVRVTAVPGAEGSVEWMATPAEFLTPTRAGHVVPGAPPLPATQRLTHGATLDGGDIAWVFLEHAEHRHPALEEAAVHSPSAAPTWADWLEAAGDPYAAPLRQMLGGQVFGARERWWLEGLGQGVAQVGARFDLGGGFLRSADVRGGTLPVDLQVLTLLSLRVALGLEHLTLHLAGFLPAASWVPFARTDFWVKAPWPATLRSLRLSATGPSLETRQCAELIGAKMPGVRVEP